MNKAPTMSKRLVAIMASILITGGISYTANAETKVDNSITSKVETSYENKVIEENGIYKINVKTLKIENDEDSMAGGYIEKEVKYTKEKGKTYCEVKLLATDWMKNIKIKVDGKEVEHTITDIGKTTVFGMEHEGGIIKFQVDSMESNLEFNMYVIPMTSDVKFRVIPQKETLEKIGDVENEEEPATKPSYSEGNDDGNITGDVNNDSKDDLTEPEDDLTKPEDDLTKPKEDKPTEDIDSSKEENPNSDKTDKEDGKDKLEESKKYEIKHQVYSENKEDLVVINKYLEDKSQIKIKDDGIYLSLKFSNLPSLNNLKIFIDGKEVNFHVEEVQYAPMLLAVRGTSSPIKIDMPNNNKIVTFKVANSKDLNELKGLKDKLKVQLHDDGLKKDINFNVGINESALNDVIKENGQSDSPVKPTNTSSSNENSGAASGGGSSSTGGSVEKNNISEVSYKVLKENNDEPSMAGEYIKKVEYETKNGKKQLIVHLNRLDWMKNIKAIVDGKEITPKTIITSTNNKGEKNGKLIFDINDLNSKIKLKMNVEPMGNARVTFRLDLSNKSTNPTNNNKTTNKTTGGKSNNNKETSKENKITEENGLYEISGKALKENSNEPSMAGTYIEKVNYEVKDGKKQLIVNLNRLDWMKNIKAMVDGKEVTPKILEVTKNDKGEERGKIIFPINSLDSDIKLQMNVEPMGNSRVTFRLDLDKNTLKNINKDKNTASNSSSSNKTDKDKKVNENKEAPKENNKEIEKGGNNSTNESKYKVENLINKKVESNHKLYDISFKALKENSDEPSMAGEYIKKVNYEEKDGKKYLIVDLDRIDWMKNIKVIVDGKESTPVITDIVKNSKGEESGRITFEIGSLDSQVMLTMNVVPMGNAKVRYRLVVDKNTLKEIPLSELKSKVSSGDIRKTSNTSNNTAKINSKVLSKKKLPQTGCPVDTVKMSVIGGILASLGFILRRKK